MSTNLFQSSANELTDAGNVQQQISQKEFEIQLVDINNRYMSGQDASSYYYNQQKKHILEMEITSLNSQRDVHINAAFLYALMLAEKEITEHSTFSRASIALANICSFLKIQNIPFDASMPLVLKISRLYSQLRMTSMEFISLRREMTNLKVQLHLP